MKYILTLAILLLFWQAEAQVVKFSDKVYKAGDNVSLTPRHLDPANKTINIKTDIVANGDLMAASDKKVTLGKVPSAGLYNIQVNFDTVLVRYYQGLVISGNIGEPTFKERVPFKIASLDTAKKVLKILLDSIQSDNMLSPNIHIKGTALLSFKMYINADQNVTIVPSFYCLAGDCSQLQQFLRNMNEVLFKTKRPEYYDLFNTVFNAPSLITPAANADVTKLVQFNQQPPKLKTSLTIYTKVSGDECSFILNLP